MGYRELHFEPGVGTTDARLRIVETHLVRSSAIISRDLADRDDAAQQQSRRISKLEAWQQGVLVWVGAQKVRWSVVAFVVGIVSAVATAGLIKWAGW